MAGYIWFNEAQAAVPVGWIARSKPEPISPLAFRPSAERQGQRRGPDLMNDFAIVSEKNAADAHSSQVTLAVEAGTPSPFCYGRWCNHGGPGDLHLRPVEQDGIMLLRGELQFDTMELADHFFTAYPPGADNTGGDCLHDTSKIRAERDRLAAKDKAIRAERRRRMERLGAALPEGESGDSEIDYLCDDDIVPPWA